ncbi:pantoate--beta-alanine ligase [bacterium]|nr:pantoate--beta-alanine ligase [bacterium]
MRIARSLSELKNSLDSLQASQKKVGFVPTMGALHSGHIALVNEAARQCEVVVCSIFVNPTQFNDPADFEKYPRTDEADIEALCETRGDIIYFPKYEELYPANQAKLIDYTDEELYAVFEGKFRPGHFQGVVTVVMRLFAHVQPNVAFFGLKDYQQFLVIQRATPHFFPNIEIKGVATVRNNEGLALSSRNKRLNETELVQAQTISAVLKKIATAGPATDIATLEAEGKATLQAKGFDTEYLAICNAKNLHHLANWHEAENYIAVCAAYINGVRLIDNYLF